MDASYRRFDLGSREASGNHGMLAAHDGALTPQQMSALLRLADSTRSQFWPHWLWVRIGSGSRALVRVSPQSGGVRGTVSTAQAAVFHELDIPPQADFRRIVQAFPPAPMEIGSPSAWEAHAGFDRLDIAAARARCENEFAALVDASPNGALRIAAAAGETAANAEVTMMLDLYGLAPISMRQRIPDLMTASAPAGLMGARPLEPARGLSTAVWWLVATSVDPGQIQDVDPRDTARLYTRWAFEMLAPSAPWGADEGRVAAKALALAQEHKFAPTLLEAFDAELDRMPAAHRMARVASIAAASRERTTDVVPGLWETRHIAAPDVLPHASRKQFGDHAPILVDRFPEALYKSHIDLTPANRLRLLQALHERVCAPDAAQRLQERQAELVRTVIESFLKDGDAATLATACATLVAAMSLGPSHAVAGKAHELHRRLCVTPRLFARALSATRHEPGTWLALIQMGVGGSAQAKLDRMRQLSKAALEAAKADATREEMRAAAREVLQRLPLGHGGRPLAAFLAAVWAKPPVAQSPVRVARMR